MTKRSSTNPVLLVALGAIAGLTAGALLADRLGGLGRLIRRDDVDHEDDGGDGEYHDGYEDEFADEFADDDADELSPESMSHVHMKTSRHRDRAEPRERSAAARMVERMTARVSGRSAKRSAAPDVAESADADLPADVIVLEERVLEAFHNDPVLRERAIDIGAIGSGVVELTGWVQSPGEIGHAVTIARGVPGVDTVVDRLTVRPEPENTGRAADTQQEANPARPLRPSLDFHSVEASAPPPRAD